MCIVDEIKLQLQYLDLLVQLRKDKTGTTAVGQNSKHFQNHNVVVKLKSIKCMWTYSVSTMQMSGEKLNQTHFKSIRFPNAKDAVSING